MPAKDFKRKLTAIFSADVAGYSRLMAEDESATVKTLETYREVMSTLIMQHRGRVIDSPGDNLLAEFSSVVDAVQCAVAVQKEFQARNAPLPENRRMKFRIGINLGDVIEEGERIYGDGVNIAARLEGLADPGGICVSKTAFEHIETKLPLGYEYLGEQEVKNIPKLVGAYRVLMEPRVTVAGKIKKEKSVLLWRRKSILAGAVALVLVVISALIWHFYFQTPPIELASVEKMAYPLPDKPSIAVLPFVNMSDDSEQEYFSDGITEEIITALSKVPDLSVIARNSSFTYKRKSVSIPTVGRELGARYVLEGSVRKANDKVRVTAQLIDAQTNSHLWAERYDRDLKDIFALQDEITMKILTAVRVKLTEGEQARLYGKRAKNLDSYMKVLEGRPYFYRFNRESNLQARQIFEEAIALEPENAHALTMLGWTYLMEVWFGSSESPSKVVDRAAELAQKAISLDDTIDSPHSLLANVYLMKRQFEMAIAEAERGVALSPNGADAQAHLGMILNYAGRREAAIASLEKAMRLNPIPPNWYLFSLGEAYFLAGEHEKALSAYEQVLRGYPDDIRALIGSTATYSLLGREEEARAKAAQILRMEPKFSLESFLKTLPFKNKADEELLFDSLHKAGLK
jgi:adenylate cyclase